MYERPLTEQNMTPIWILMGVYIFVFWFYLWAEDRNDGKQGFVRATTLKLTLSSLFCAVAVLGYVATLQIPGVHSEYYYGARLVTMLGLFFCIPGDFFLQYIRLDNMKYRVGILFFLCAQVLFLGGMCLLDMFGGWWWTVTLTLVVLIGAMILMNKQHWVLGDERGVLTLYTFFLALTAMRALVTFVNAAYVSSLLLFVGAALFLASDMVLGIWNYADGSRKLQKLNWKLYFAGTMLIALSVSPTFDFLLI